MIKKIYHISGFDCPNCAAKAEAHLNKKDNIAYARLDFAANRLYLTYKEQPYTLDELKEAIKEVEDDPLTIEEYVSEVKKKEKLMTPRMWVLVGRIIYAVLVTVICLFFLTKIEYNWLRFGLYTSAAIVISYDIIWKVILHIKNRAGILDHFLLITIASLGAFGLGILQMINEPDECIKTIGGLTIAHDETMEAVMVATLFQIGRIIETIATTKSKDAVMAAVELRVEEANLITEEGIKVVRPEELKVEDKIIVKVGELIPVDGEVIDGEALIDTSSLTGEYVPTRAKQDTQVFSGCLVKSGTITVEVKKVYKDSTVSKIIELISEGGEKKSKADEFIAKFAKWYTPIVVVIAALALIIGGLITKEWPEWVERGLEILVIGCPCAIVISVPLAYFSAIGLASQNGIVIKGSNYLDELANMGMLISDKTGTLTHGSFSIQKVVPSDGIDEEELLEYLYAVESLSTHPIGKAICHGKNLKKIASEQKKFLEIPGLGVESYWKRKHLLAGGEKLMSKFKIAIPTVEDVGTPIHLAVNKKYYGYIVLSDQIKEDAQPMVDLLHSQRVEIVLLTGDNEDNARDICNKLGIDRWHSGLLPEDKTKYLVEEMENTSKAVAFIGDGINDAPSIIRSDIGIAMGGIGSDIAVENADVVIMNDDPAKVYDAMRIAKMARATSIFNIAFALLIKIGVAIMALIPSFEVPMWVAVLADTGLTVVLVINSLLLLYRKVRRKKQAKK